MESELTAPKLQPPDSRLNVSDREQLAGRRWSVWIWLVLGLLVAIAIGVLLALPKLIEPKASEPGINTDRAETTTRQPQQQAEPVTSLQSHDAAEALKQFLRVRAEPALAQAEIWAPEDWKIALDAAQTGDDHYGRKQFSEALSAYQDAGRQLTKILESRALRLAEYLSAGQTALDQNQSAEAIEGFELALAMAPENPMAAQGLARARVRDQVLTLMKTGEQAEQTDDPDSAFAAYTEASRLDAEYQPAKEALDRVNTVIANIAFDRAMSSALQNLKAGKFTDAEKALDIAEKLNSTDPAVTDTRQRVRTAKRLVALSGLREQANKLVAEEDWKPAADVYRKALKIDTEASFAVTGLALTEDRISLHSQLDHYLADTGRLSSNEPLINAKKLVESNRNIPEGEPQLASKVKTLSEAIHLAELPVTLLLQSDNQTEVTIYHVGRLGKFYEKSLTLKPGRYTVTGFCPGYRDVRKVI
ncbi:MAG: hypothetical protein ACR2QW_19945, partial [bacterium]